LQISPNKRPDCYQILNLEYVQSKIKELRGNTIESSRNEDEVILINTIKLPKDMIEINKKLPKNYSLPLTYSIINISEIIPHTR